MVILFAFKKRQLKQKTQDANFSKPIENPESDIKKRIPDSDSKIGPKNGRIPDPDCQPYYKYSDRPIEEKNINVVKNNIEHEWDKGKQIFFPL